MLIMLTLETDLNHIFSNLTVVSAITESRMKLLCDYGQN